MRFSRILFIVLELGFLTRLQAAQCGTALFFQKNLNSSGVQSQALHKSTAAAVFARTLESEHFLFNYSLQGLHKPHFTSADSTLSRMADSLYALFPGGKAAKNDSAVYARLDAAGAPAPQFVLKEKQYFEAAWTYYVTQLGMRTPPNTTVRSAQYKVSAVLPNKFPVDIADISTADPIYAGQTYGITYVPNNLSITVENDFIFNETLDMAGEIHGDSIKSVLPGLVIRNYGADWEMGIKVTASHEFYHAIQFAYTPSISNFHVWYEISATGMEEVLAPEVNDYLQYLPCVLSNHDRLSLTSHTGCPFDPVYGQSIFHQFLEKTLDSTFDVKVWTTLSGNGNTLNTALESVFSKFGKSMVNVFPDYATQLLFSGGRFAKPISVFSPDMSQWPATPFDSIDLSAPIVPRSFTLPLLTYTFLKVKGQDNGNPQMAVPKSVLNMTRVYVNADTSIIEQIGSGTFSLSAPKNGFTGYYLVFPNSSFTVSATVQIKPLDSAALAVVPPSQKSQKRKTLCFTRGDKNLLPLLKGADVYDEKGKTLRNTPVTPGIYFYRMGREPMETLVILP